MSYFLYHSRYQSKPTHRVFSQETYERLVHGTQYLNFSIAGASVYHFKSLIYQICNLSIIFAQFTSCERKTKTGLHRLQKLIDNSDRHLWEFGLIIHGFFSNYIGILFFFFFFFFFFILSRNFLILNSQVFKS